MRLRSVAPARLLTRIKSKRSIIWNILQEVILSCGIFHFYAVMFQAVGYDQVVYVEDQVIAGYLVKDFLGDGYGGALVFHYYFGLTGFVVDYRVAATGHSVE